MQKIIKIRRFTFSQKSSIFWLSKKYVLFFQIQGVKILTPFGGL